MTPARSLRTTFSHNSGWSPTVARSRRSSDRFAVFTRSLWQGTQDRSRRARCLAAGETSAAGVRCAARDGAPAKARVDSMARAQPGFNHRLSRSPRRLSLCGLCVERRISSRALSSAFQCRLHVSFTVLTADATSHAYARSHKIHRQNRASAKVRTPLARYRSRVDPIRERYRRFRNRCMLRAERIARAPTSRRSGPRLAVSPNHELPVHPWRRCKRVDRTFRERSLPLRARPRTGDPPKRVAWRSRAPSAPPSSGTTSSSTERPRPSCLRRNSFRRCPAWPARWPRSPHSPWDSSRGLSAAW